MKKFLLILAGIMFMASASFAQSNMQGNKMASAKAAKKTYKYYCPKCWAGSNKPGECKMCHVKMVKVGDYYCPDCYATSTKPGMCKKCNKEMVMMEAPKKE